MNNLTLEVQAAETSVSALVQLPADCGWLYVFGHGAGAGMRHKSMQAIADSLFRAGIGTLRYNFPYMERLEKGEKPIGQRFAKPPLIATVRAAVSKARELVPTARLFAGGKSMGGRMTSLAAAEQGLPEVEALVFYGFPLHPAGKPSTERAEHLKGVYLPMLFLQGERDELATPELMREVSRLLERRATLFEIPGADHSLKTSRAQTVSEREFLDGLASLVLDWLPGSASGVYSIVPNDKAKSATIVQR